MVMNILAHYQSHNYKHAWILLILVGVSLAPIFYISSIFGGAASIVLINIIWILPIIIGVGFIKKKNWGLWLFLVYVIGIFTILFISAGGFKGLWDIGDSLLYNLRIVN